MVTVLPMLLYLLFGVLQASADMEEIFLFIDNLNKRLSRGIKDLDDVRSSMAALNEIRESEIRFARVDDIVSVLKVLTCPMGRPFPSLHFLSRVTTGMYC